VKSIETTPSNSAYRTGYSILREKTSQGKCVCKTTKFALMESIDQLKEHEFYLKEIHDGKLAGTAARNAKTMDLNDIEIENAVRRVLDWQTSNSDLVIVEPLEFAGSLLELPYAISEKSCVSAPDCIHLASALLLGCDVILTGDTQLRREVRERLSSPSSALYQTALEILALIIGVSRIELVGLTLGSPLIEAWDFTELSTKSSTEAAWRRTQPPLQLRLSVSANMGSDSG
jgi:predicted nucleic acid-binding protein